MSMRTQTVSFGNDIENGIFNMFKWGKPRGCGKELQD